MIGEGIETFLPNILMFPLLRRERITCLSKEFDRIDYSTANARANNRCAHNERCKRLLSLHI